MCIWINHPWHGGKGGIAYESENWGESRRNKKNKSKQFKNKMAFGIFSPGHTVGRELLSRPGHFKSDYLVLRAKVELKPKGTLHIRRQNFMWSF